MVTIAEVKDGFATDASDEQIELALAIVDQADECLTKNEVTEAIAVALKVYAVRHILVMQANAGRGEVRGETAPSGASRQYASYTGGHGSKFLELVRQIDRWGCVRRVLERQQTMYLQAVGVKQ